MIIGEIGLVERKSNMSSDFMSTYRSDWYLARLVNRFDSAEKQMVMLLVDTSVTFIVTSPIKCGCQLIIVRRDLTERVYF